MKMERGPGGASPRENEGAHGWAEGSIQEDDRAKCDEGAMVKRGWLRRQARRQITDKNSDHGGRARCDARQRCREGKILIAARTAVQGVGKGGNVMAGTAVVVTAGRPGKFVFLGTRGFEGTALTGSRLLEGGMAALLETQDRTRGKTLPGHQQDQEADQ
jgi:hypothetical protein